VSEHAAVVVVPLALLAGSSTLPAAEISRVIGVPLGTRQDHLPAAAEVLMVRDSLQVIGVEAQSHPTQVIHDLVREGVRSVSSFVGGAMDLVTSALTRRHTYAERPVPLFGYCPGPHVAVVGEADAATVVRHPLAAYPIPE
jgi:hypothetical protein